MPARISTSNCVCHVAVRACRTYPCIFIHSLDEMDVWPMPWSPFIFVAFSLYTFALYCSILSLYIELLWSFVAFSLYTVVRFRRFVPLFQNNQVSSLFPSILKSTFVAFSLYTIIRSHHIQRCVSPHHGPIFYARYLYSWNSAGAKTVGVVSISPRAFRRRIVRYCLLLALLTPSWLSGSRPWKTAADPCGIHRRIHRRFSPL